MLFCQSFVVKSRIVFVWIGSFLLLMYSFVVLLYVVVTWCKSNEYKHKMFECVLYRLYITSIVKGILIFEGVMLFSFLPCFLSFFFVIFLCEKWFVLYVCFTEGLSKEEKGSIVVLKGFIVVEACVTEVLLFVRLCLL